MNRISRWILSLSLIASCASVIGLSGVQAQDQRQDRRDIRQDQSQIRAYRKQIPEERREHDRSALRYYHGQINQLRSDMRGDRRDMRQDHRRRHRSRRSAWASYHSQP